jgi:cellulose biosynthesis protein BcsQ
MFYVGGSKGGVGKSLTSIAAIDAFQRQGRRILLIDADEANPDVLKAYESQSDTVTGYALNLNDKNEWAKLIDIIEQYPDHVVVINSAAGALKAAMARAAMLQKALPELNRTLTVLWPINRQRDGLEAVADFLEVLDEVKVHIVRNGHFGEEHKFELYNSSKLRQTIEARGGKSLLLPELADRVADEIYTNRVAINTAVKTMSTGARVELIRWRDEVEAMFAEILA